MRVISISFPITIRMYPIFIGFVVTIIIRVEDAGFYLSSQSCLFSLRSILLQQERRGRIG